VNAGSTLNVPDGAICGGGSTTLTANVSNPGGEFAWSPGSFGNVNSITVSPNTTTNYFISYTIAGCEILETATVFVGALPTLTTDDATVCSGSQAAVHAIGSPSGGIYTWENPPAPAGSNNDSLVIANPNSSEYYPVSYNLNGCIAHDSSLITVNYKPTATVNDNAACQGNSAPLTAIVDSSGGSYFWSPGSYPNTQSITVNPPATTVYTLMYTLGSCSDTTTATVSVINSPSVSVNSPTICEGDSAVLTANGSPNGGTYEWSFNNQTTPSIVVSPPSTTNYNVTYTINGCVTNTAATVTVEAPFTVNAGSNSPVCPGSTIAFNVSPAGGTYSWTGPNGFNSLVENASINNADSSHQGNYVVIVTLNGCSVSDSTTVDVVDLVADFSADPLSGCAPMEVDFINLSNNITEATWTFGDGNGSGLSNNSNGQSHIYQNSGLYSVTLVISDGGSCFDTLTIPDYIYVEDQPIASFSPTPGELKELDQTSTMNNNSIGGFTYLWTFPDSTSSTELSPNHTFNLQPGESGTVTLYVYSELGCSDIIQESVRIIEDVIYYVPNSFTPNGDPSNHYFQPVMSSGIDVVSYNLIIYNRWGENVFESNDINTGWDGTYKNEACPNGVYTYKIFFIEKENDRKHEVVGHVTLFK
jgi:gliding motility-associated-like protein